MKASCEDFERFQDAGERLPLEGLERWRRHLEGCRRCRRQVDAHGLLRAALSDPPELAFSADFEHRLRRGLRRRRARWGIGVGARLFLAAYSCFASAMAVRFLSRVEWRELPSFDLVALGLVALALIGPLVFLPRASPLHPPGT